MITSPLEIVEKLSVPTLNFLKETKTFYGDVELILLDAIDTGNGKILVEKIPGVVKPRRTEVEEEAREWVKYLDAAVADLSGQITIEALSTLFTPTKKLSSIVTNFFDLLCNLTPQARMVEQLCEFRNHLEQLSPAKASFKDEVDDLLDRQESELMWHSSYAYWEYLSKAWSLYYSTLQYPEMTSVSLAIRNAAFAFAYLQLQWAKLWGYTFGDRLRDQSSSDFGDFFEGTKKTNEIWIKSVRECFSVGFQTANKFLKENGIKILRELLVEFVFSAVGVKVQEFILSPKNQLKPSMESVAKAIRPPVNEILDIDNIAREAINKSLMEKIAASVSSGMIDPFIDTYTKTQL